ncbi:MAG: hypothetical protein Q9207_002792 [Kuettlingeria erythrocarpa]
MTITGISLSLRILKAAFVVGAVAVIVAIDDTITTALANLAHAHILPLSLYLGQLVALSAGVTRLLRDFDPLPSAWSCLLSFAFVFVLICCLILPTFARKTGEDAGVPSTSLPAPIQESEPEQLAASIVCSADIEPSLPGSGPLDESAFSKPEDRILEVALRRTNGRGSDDPTSPDPEYTEPAPAAGDPGAEHPASFEQGGPRYADDHVPEYTGRPDLKLRDFFNGCSIAEQQWYRQDLQRAKEQSYEEGRSIAEQEYRYEIQIRDEHIRREEEGCQKFERVAAEVIQESHSLKQENNNLKQENGELKEEICELKKKLEDRKEKPQVNPETKPDPVVQPDRSELPEPSTATPVQQPPPQATPSTTPAEPKLDSAPKKRSTEPAKKTPVSPGGSNVGPSSDAGHPKPVPTSAPKTTSHPTSSSSTSTSTSKAPSPPPSHSSTSLPNDSQAAPPPLESDLSDFDGLEDGPSTPDARHDALWLLRVKYIPGLVSGEVAGCADGRAVPNTNITGGSRNDHTASPTNSNGTDLPSHPGHDSQAADAGDQHMSGSPLSGDTADIADDTIMADIPTVTGNDVPTVNDDDVPMPDSPPVKLCTFIAQQPPPMLRGAEARRKRSCQEDDPSSSRVKRILTAHPRPEFYSETKDKFKKRQAMLLNRARLQKRDRVMLCDRPSHDASQWFLEASQRMDYWYNSDSEQSSGQR